jgi:hypothetical protein
MHFRTILKQEPHAWKVSLADPLLTIGSCFSDSIGRRLGSNKFNVLINPFGTIYNPLSIHTLLIRAIENEPLPDHYFIQRNEVHANYLFHSQFNALSRNELESSLTSKLVETKQQLSSAAFILITYGTSWVYKLKESGEIVSNCHKMPSTLFEKQLLTQQQITEDFGRLVTTVRKINRNIKIILTVSPVRHIKDTLTLNSVSKSVLRLACHELTQHYSDVEYFPAFEIMMDDLRDYRFYKDDLIHPTEFAENYIWQQFADTYFEENTKLFLKKWGEIASALQHKPFIPDSPSHRSFLQSILTKLDELKTQVNVTKEKEFIDQQLEQSKI